MNQSNVIYLEVSDELDSRTYMKEGKENVINFQVCDLHHPDKRHPVDYQLTYFQPEMMLKPGIYYPSHESFFLGQYGLNAGKYVRWISIEDLQKELTQVIKQTKASTATPLKAAS